HSIYIQSLARADQILCENVARRTLVYGYRTAAEAGSGRIEQIDAHLNDRIGVDDTEPPRVVEVQTDPLLRPALADRTDDAFHAFRVSPAHRVGEAQHLDVGALFSRDAEDVVDRPDHPLDRDVAFATAPERRHDRGAPHGNAVLLVDADLITL